MYDIPVILKNEIRYRFYIYIRININFYFIDETIIVKYEFILLYLLSIFKDDGEIKVKYSISFLEIFRDKNEIKVTG